MLRSSTVITILDRTDFLIQIRRLSNCLQTALSPLSFGLSRNCKNIGRLEFVRYKKPVWAPIAGSKLHRVSQRHKIDPEEAADSKKRNTHYKTLRKSLYQFFQQEAEALEAQEIKNKASEIVDTTHRDESIRRINDEWNKKSAELRKVFDAEEAKVKDEEYLKLLEEFDAKKKEKTEEARKRVQQVLAEKESYIDLSRLDEAIEESLNKRSAFNFFIDKEGRRFVENLDGSVVEVTPDGEPVEKKAGIEAEPALEFVEGEVFSETSELTDSGEFEASDTHSEGAPWDESVNKK